MRPFESDGTVAMWKQSGQSLDYAISELGLGSYKFKACVLAAPATYFMLHPEAANAARDRACRTSEPCVVRLPVEAERNGPEIPRNRLRYEIARERQYFVRFDTSFTDYMAKFSAKSRSTLQRKRRKFAELSGGEIDWRIYQAPAELSQFYPLAADLSNKTWQEKVGSGGFKTAVGEETTLLALAALQGARGYMLFLQGKAIAYACCLNYGETLLYMVLGFDPEHQSQSPGDVLLLLVLERLFRDREFQYLDFGWNELPHKKFFATGSIETAYTMYFPRTLKTLALVGLHTGLNRSTSLAGRALDAMNLRSRIRMLLQQATRGSVFALDLAPLGIV